MIEKTSAGLTGRRGLDGQGVPDDDRASEPSAYHVYGRLLSEATNELHGWARQALDDALAGVQREIDHKYAELLERAYTRGVRDGYVQAVAEAERPSDLCACGDARVTCAVHPNTGVKS